MHARLLVIAGLLIAGCSARSAPGSEAKEVPAGKPPGAASPRSASTAAPPRLDVAGKATDADVAALVAAVVDDETPPDTIRGQVIDSAAGDAQPGVLIVATARGAERSQLAITDQDGEYELTLPSGVYELAFYYDEVELTRREVAVTDDHATAVDVELELPALAPRQVDVNRVEHRNIPIPGRTFEMALGTAAGSQSDPPGDESFSSHCGLENEYYVDDDAE